jgi:signal recognition particle subunit SEC65
VKDPSVQELEEAARRLGYKPEPCPAKRPNRMAIQSGYVSIEKRANLKKSQVIADMSKTLSNVRGEKAADAGTTSKDQQRTPPKKR